MVKSFLDRPSPVITAIMAGQTPQELMAQARNSEFDGAGGIAIDLSDLKCEFRTEENFRAIIEAVNLPFMFFLYRDDKHGPADDEQRQEVLLEAAAAGASMIDVMGDLYDPSEMEITHDQKAIDKQLRLIEQVRARGAEVVISSHMDCARSTEQVLDHLRELEKRDPDVVKIVTTVNTEEELAEAFRTTMILKRELKKPFIHLCNGRFHRPHRCFSPAMGPAIVFAVQCYEPRYLMHQPTITAMKAILDNVHWNIDNN